MKIISWNANGAFRKKYKEILKQDADIYIIIECEDPQTIDDADYHKAIRNPIWHGGISYKGMMVFSNNPEIAISPLDWEDHHHRYFLPLRVNNRFNLVASWACDPYCVELYRWLTTVYGYLDEDSIVIGDLNSSVVLDANKKKSDVKFIDCIKLFAEKNMVDIWHFCKSEKQGEESCPTFFLYRHLDKQFHIDHCFSHPKNIKDMKILTRWEWLSLSDHLPLSIELNV